MDSILPQLAINGLIAGSIYALAASGLSISYHVFNFFNFGQGAVISLSAYAFFFFIRIAGFGLLASIFLSLMMSIILSLLANLLYRKLRVKKSTSVVLMICSLALLTFTSSLILALFGSGTKTISLKFNRTLDFGFFSITILQSAIIASSLALFLILRLVIGKTRLGKAMRAVADNKQMAQIVGINPEKIYAIASIMTGMIGSIAGILIALEQNLYPQMGMPVIIKGFIGAIVGGIGSVPGAIIGGLLIGLCENIGIVMLPSSYKDVISFGILVLFLIAKPSGILGVKTRDA